PRGPFLDLSRQRLKKSALIWMYCFWSSGTSLSCRIALTGHTGSHAPHSMQTSGSMKYILSASVVWIQSTGQASTHDASLTSMHGSQMVYVTLALRCEMGSGGELSA